MKTYLISYNNENNSPIINDRIKSLGDYDCLNTTQFLVQSSFDNADEVYRIITKDDFSKMTIFIISVNPMVQSDYWGVGRKELWTWLDSHR